MCTFIYIYILKLAGSLSQALPFLQDPTRSSRDPPGIMDSDANMMVLDPKDLVLNRF